MTCLICHQGFPILEGEKLKEDQNIKNFLTSYKPTEKNSAVYRSHLVHRDFELSCSSVYCHTKFHAGCLCAAGTEIVRIQNGWRCPFCRAQMMNPTSRSLYLSKANFTESNKHASLNFSAKPEEKPSQPEEVPKSYRFISIPTIYKPHNVTLNVFPEEDNAIIALNTKNQSVPKVPSNTTSRSAPILDLTNALIPNNLIRYIQLQIPKVAEQTLQAYMVLVGKEYANAEQAITQLSTVVLKPAVAIWSNHVRKELWQRPSNARYLGLATASQVDIKRLWTSQYSSSSNQYLNIRKKTTGEPILFQNEMIPDPATYPAETTPAEEDFEIEETSIQLHDPMTMAPIAIPAKGDICTHETYFDLSTYISFNFNKPTWKCPCCEKIVMPQQICIDSYMLGIIRMLDKHIKTGTVDETLKYAQNTPINEADIKSGPCNIDINWKPRLTNETKEIMWQKDGSWYVKGFNPEPAGEAGGASSAASDNRKSKRTRIQKRHEE